MTFNKAGIAFIFVACAIAFTKISSGQYISEVLEYTPAPGQYINAAPWGIPSSAESIIGNINGTLSLGSFGGYVIFKFEHPVQNGPDNPYGIDFTIFGNPTPEWAEPGCVFVMNDENQNDLVDDTWYQLAGSDYFFSPTIKNYEVTYQNPSQGDADIPWYDNLGNEGVIPANSMYPQPYYPMADSFPHIPINEYSLQGLRIEGFLDSSNVAFVKSFPRAFGYADNKTRGYPPYTIPDNPYTRETENSGGDAFDIDWAVDEYGGYVELDEIHFVKVQNATMTYAGWLGHLSTEITGAVDVSPDAGTTGINEMIVIKDLPLVIDTIRYQMEVYFFENGRLQNLPEIEWNCSQEGAFVDDKQVLHLNSSGEIEITASLTGNNQVSTTVQSMIVLPDIGIEKSVLDSDVALVPNPVYSFFEIIGIEVAEISVYDQAGKARWVSRMYRKGNLVDVSGLNPGVYFVLVDLHDRKVTLKMVKL